MQPDSQRCKPVQYNVDVDLQLNVDPESRPDSVLPEPLDNELPE